MGGDNDPRSVLTLLATIREEFPHLHTGWYSGRDQLPTFFSEHIPPTYVKVGSWRAECGPLNSRSTNQRLYRYETNGQSEDITSRFWKE